MGALSVAHAPRTVCLAHSGVGVVPPRSRAANILKILAAPHCLHLAARPRHRLRTAQRTRSRRLPFRGVGGESDLCRPWAWRRCDRTMNGISLVTAKARIISSFGREESVHEVLLLQ